MSLTDPTFTDLTYICLNMREVDATEILALQNHDSLYRLAWETHYAVTNHGRGKIAWHKGAPAAFAFFREERPGVWEVGMFGTNAFRDACVPLLRWFRQEANEILSVCNGHRLHCHSISTHEEAHKMIEAMGGKRGPVERKYGKGGEDFVSFQWFNGENDAVLKSGYVRAA